MPLNFGNLIVGNQSINQQIEPSTPTNEIKEESSLRAESSKGSFVVVDGKQKKISKHSAYLLDMLTIDEE